MTTSIVAQTFDQKVAKVAAELLELIAEGLPVAVDADRLVELEAKGFVVNLFTGEIVEPVLPLGVVYA